MRTENSQFPTLDRVIKNQRRVFFVNIVATAMFAGGLIASLAALL